jgi:TIGR03009 family protein
MLRHHWLAWTSLVLLIPAAQAQQQPPKNPPPQTQPPPLSPQEKSRALEACLGNWEKAMRNMESFSAEVDRVEYDKQFGSQEMYSGAVKYLKPGKFLIDVKKPNKPEDYDKWLCTGNNIYQFVPKSKKVNVVELPKSSGSGEDSVMSVLGCIKAEEARKRYDLDYVKEDQYYHYIEIRPKSAEDKNEFTWARLVLRKDTFLPREIRFQFPSSTEVLWNIRSLQLNAPLDGKEFAIPDVPTGWKMEKAPRTVRP